MLETVFSVCNVSAMAGWIALLAAPLARDRMVLLARVVCALLCAAYLTQLFTITEPSGGSFQSLAGVSLLFSKGGNVMLGWTHYLAFDLFVGSCEVEDAGRKHIPHWLMIPILIATFLVGPIGFLVYVACRMAWRGRTTPKHA
jgi:hypothetical protein